MSEEEVRYMIDQALNPLTERIWALEQQLAERAPLYHNHDGRYPHEYHEHRTKDHVHDRLTGQPR